MVSRLGKLKISSAAQRPDPSALGEHRMSMWSAPAITSKVVIGISLPW